MNIEAAESLYDIRIRWLVQDTLTDARAYCAGAICCLIVAFASSPWSMLWAFVFLAIGCRHALVAKRIAALEARALISNQTDPGKEEA